MINKENFEDIPQKQMSQNHGHQKHIKYKGKRDIILQSVSFNECNQSWNIRKNNIMPGVNDLNDKFFMVIFLVNKIQ